MPVPPLQLNGLLPPGTHRATIAEIIAAFPARTLERQELNQALQDASGAIVKLQTQAPDILIYVDGSYVTQKSAPIDIDFLFLTDMFDEVQIQDFFRQECPIPTTYFDIHADPLQRQHLLRIFTRTRNGTPKGIILLEV
jgi:hypothetical protein